MNPKRPTALIPLFLILILAAPLRADEDFPYALYADSESLHFGILGGLTALNFLVLRELQDAPTGEEKRARGEDFDKGDLNPLDRSLMAPWNSTISRTGDVMLCLTAAGTGGALLALPELEGSERATLAVMLTETLLWNLNAQFLLKYGFPRYRPYNYEDSTTAPTDRPDSRESFPSGHAMYAVSSAVFFHSVYRELRPGGPSWPLWAAYGAAGCTAVLRVASGRHFVSDVLVGAGIGALIGYLIPLQNRLIHNSRSAVLPRLIPLVLEEAPGIGVSITY